MGGQSKGIFDRLYNSAENPEDLPWYEVDPPELLVKALDQRESAGTALDIGCGAGTNSIYMAERGYQVTAIDFMPQAITMLTKQIAVSDLAIEAVQADVGKWTTKHTFDVILDIGCLHTPGTIAIDAYKAQLLNWLAPGGDFILVHFGRRGWWDWWPIGPSRIYADTICQKFAPEFELVEDISEDRSDMPFFIGRSACIGRYWFRRG
ncbi:MAG: class I SAM-dependent methyltransferase [Gammaproteobacteria bacterium]|nr:class I SAM-dependent methyltransferase [Gammaproteobacteria bacterium]MCP4088353.1 class I SAM-dependent methyltransferase [Gammaproteobacteria bacterium]MCP4275109.1 class I SAM-dependent methyltransferase [Gammaproteobacteria bacterium]MCP4830983.1 class I SAM-dependent methyltransferase [Gammaproteobacteria bacterium]MCP4927496.1 class I SAM-dependent methyltransferase [Gammaproteobacteria bacterium]